jgi:DNA-binding SARP family transcriptional activator/streptogramin lyase
MLYRILGPLEVADGDREVVLGRGRQRSVLALLLLHANEVVSSDRLIEALWGDLPPPTAAKTVQVYVSQLRKSLRNGDSEGPLLTRGPGYVLRIGHGELDLHRFERALAEGRDALDADAPGRAADALRAGLGLWRGPPLADFTYEPFAQAEIARLEELRLAAIEQRVEADLELGRHAEVVGELDALVAEHPLREGLRGQLMLALYRCDRQAEALETHRRGRHLLVEELGIEPSPALRRLHEQILAQDPALGAAGRSHRPPRPPPSVARLPAAVARRPRVLVAAGLALVATALGAAAIQSLRADPGPQRPEVPLTYSALARVAPASGTVEHALALPDVSRLAVAGGRVWVGGDDARNVSAVDARTGRLTRTVTTRLFPSDVAAGEGAVWVVDGARGRVARIEPSYGRFQLIPFHPSGETPPDRFDFEPTSIAAGEGAAWITDGGEQLLRVDPGTGAVRRIPTGRPLVGVAAGAGAVWAISGKASELLRIDPRTLKVRRLPIVSGPGLESAFPRAVAVGGGFVWVVNGNTGAVTKIDAAPLSVDKTIPIGVERAPEQLAADSRAVWIANGDGTLARIDIARDEVTFHDVGRALRDVAVGEGKVWTTNRLSDCCGQEE